LIINELFSNLKALQYVQNVMLSADATKRLENSVTGRNYDDCHGTDTADAANHPKKPNPDIFCMLF
jgi:hypothetical protein